MAASPVLHRADVVVVSATPAGITAAREGHTVLLLEYPPHAEGVSTP